MIILKLKNFPPSATTKEIKQFVSKYGEINNILKEKNFALVEVNNEKKAQELTEKINNAGIKFRGKQITAIWSKRDPSLFNTKNVCFDESNSSTNFRKNVSTTEIYKNKYRKINAATADNIHKYTDYKFNTSKSSEKIILEASIRGVENFAILLKTFKGKINENLFTQFQKSIISKLRIALRYTHTHEGFIIISEIPNVDTALKILNIKHIQGHKINSSVLIGSVSSKFVICSVNPEYSLKDLVCCLEKDAVSVIAVQRILKYDKGLLPTHSVVVTQIGYTIPKIVKVRKKNHVVRNYEEKPIFCLKCLRYGHREKFCIGEVACNICSESHYYRECTVKKLLKCNNCRKCHKAQSQDCEHFQREKMILAIKNKLHISRGDAVREFEINRVLYTRNESMTSDQDNWNTALDDAKNEMDKKLEELNVKMNKKIEELEAEVKKMKH